jgi:hypothetical protein
MILQDFVDPQAWGTLVMDIRQLESADQNLNNDEEFGEESASEKNHRQKEKELLQSTWSVLKQDLGFRSSVRATYLAQSTIRGITYSKLSKHAGNANILMKIKENQLLRPAKIMKILRIEQDIVMLVQYHLEPPPQAQNPFHDYPIFQTSIWDINVEIIL